MKPGKARRELKTSMTSRSVRFARSTCGLGTVQPVERVRHVDDAALALDLRDRLGEGHAAGDRALEEEADDLALASS